MRSLSCVAIAVVVTAAACSHDWDLLEPDQAPGAGGSGGATTTSTSTQGGSTSTQGGAPACTTVNDCTPSGSVCASTACDNGSCVTTVQPDGTLITAGDDSNCLDTVCQGGQPATQPNFQHCNDPVPDNCVVPNCTAAGACQTNPLMNAPQGYPCVEAGVNGTCDGNGNCI